MKEVKWFYNQLVDIMEELKSVYPEFKYNIGYSTTTTWNITVRENKWWHPNQMKIDFKFKKAKRPDILVIGSISAFGSPNPMFTPVLKTVENITHKEIVRLV